MWYVQEIGEIVRIGHSYIVHCVLGINKNCG